jgi:sulfur-carrier protein
MIRVLLPTPLWRLAAVNREIELQVEGIPTIRSTLDALEAEVPTLRGTIRDQVTKERRAYIRFFADGEDISLDPPETPLPEAVRLGREPLRIVGALAGGS